MNAGCFSRRFLWRKGVTDFWNCRLSSLPLDWSCFEGGHVKKFLKNTVLGLVGVLSFSVSPHAYAGETDLEEAYLDLVFGHCFQEILGQSLRFNPNPGTSPDWSKMSTPQGASNVDLRTLDFEKGDLVVNMQNKGVCWTQAGTPDPSTLAARIRLEVMDGKYDASLFSETVEQSPEGQISKLSIIGINGWPEADRIPVVTIREMIEPQQKMVITQVMIGQKK